MEGFHRIVGLRGGRIQLVEGVQQQRVDDGLLIGQHGEHLEPHGRPVVVGAQQFLELVGANRRALSRLSWILSLVSRPRNPCSRGPLITDC